MKWFPMKITALRGTFKVLFSNIQTFLHQLFSSLNFISGRGQDTNTVGQTDATSPEMVPVVEWRPIVVGYRSLKDGSVTNRDDIPQNNQAVKSHPFFPNMVFPSMPVSQ